MPTPPNQKIKPPSIYGYFSLDDAVIDKLSELGANVVSSHAYGRSQWYQCVKVVTELAGGATKSYFIKIATGTNCEIVCKGEFESMKAINAVLPTIAPEPYVWGKQKNKEAYYMISEFRIIGQQPPEPKRFTARLAELHRVSISPTGKFGFHTTTCFGRAAQLSDIWESSWAKLYEKQLAHMFALDLGLNGSWPEFQRMCDLTLKNTIPRLLGALESNGRSIKPCLVHGDCWDENTATDLETGEPFIFDSGAFYGHNEFELGTWRTPLHRLSGKEYVDAYKRNFAPSEPAEEWDDRNLLYSIRFDIGCSILEPGCSQRADVFANMKQLFRKYFPEDYAAFIQDIGELAVSTAGVGGEKQNIKKLE
ncbi:Fructosamine kinase-domain-containing protein [Bisporella sp. PMI_857]|nr:Fructosamine kinase-domain-containing protein [Bisporella sp. PMI_857]